MVEPITAVLIGAGNRGKDVYGRYALTYPNNLHFVAVAEPNPIRRKKFAEEHNIPPKRRFTSWEELLSLDKLATAAVITTQDQLHTQPALAALEKGYHVLLEKPMATTLEECRQLVDTAEKVDRHLQICHVLRYTSFFSTIKQVIVRKLIGDVITIEHRENVSYWHMVHSYVRGNWRNSEESSPMILAKCCHDLDILYWLVDSRPMKISSFGTITHFTSDNAPKGAPQRCLDGCPVAESCSYYAPRIYINIIPILRIARKGGSRFIRFLAYLALDHPRVLNILKTVIPPIKSLAEYDGWPVSIISEDSSLKGRLEVLKNGPYGRCVYHCDNNVVDHQIVGIEFQNGVTANLTMHGHSHEEGRTIRIDGTKGTLIGEFMASGHRLVLYDHLSGKERTLLQTGLELGHGGGDEGLTRAFVQLLRQKNLQMDPLTSARASLESHLMAFAAEKSRISGKVVDMDEFRK
ncbi:MAG: Gfo/Idh/MocA family protein [Promethearchaeota archaeon]